MTGEAAFLFFSKSAFIVCEEVERKHSLLSPSIKSKDERTFQYHFFGNTVSEYTRCKCCVESKSV